MPDFAINQYSIFSALVLFTVITFFILLLSRNTLFIVKHGVHIILVAIIFALLRLLLPFDLYWAKTISLNSILMPIDNLFNQTVVGIYTVKTFLYLIWMIGSIAFLCYSSYALVKDIRTLENITTVEGPILSAAIKDYPNPNILVKVSPCIDVPKVWGVFTAHIYLPDLALSAEEWKTILNHEIQHVKNHDTLIKGLMLVITALLWWNPVVHLLYKELDHILELRCDAVLIKSYTREERTTYLDLILKVLRQLRNNTARKSYLMASLVNTSTYGFTKQRFEIVAHSEKPLYKTRLCWYLLTVFLFFVSYFFIFQPAAYPADADSYDTVVPNLILFTKDKEYHLYIDGTYYKELSEEELEDPQYSEIEIIKEN